MSRSLLDPDAHPLSCSGWQAEPEPGHPMVRLDSNPTARRLHKLLDQRQADPRPASRSVTRFLDTVEALEDVGQVDRRDALAAVTDADHDRPVVDLGANRHGATFRGVTG